MIFEKAKIEDIRELVTLRIAYLEEDDGVMDNDILLSIKANLLDYFIKDLNQYQLLRDFSSMSNSIKKYGETLNCIRFIVN